MPNITVYIPKDLFILLRKDYRKLNKSKIVSIALRRAISNKKERNEK